MIYFVHVVIMDTESWKFLRSVCILSFLLGSCFVYQSLRVVVAQDEGTEPAVTLQVNASNGAGRLIPETLFGIFFEVLLMLQPPKWSNYGLDLRVLLTAIWFKSFCRR